MWPLFQGLDSRIHFANGRFALIRIVVPEAMRCRSTAGASSGAYSLPRKIAAIMRGLRRPCNTAITHNGFSSGA